MADTIVDYIIEESGTGVIVLWATQHEPWDFEGLILRIKDKINSYVSVIKNGSLAEKFPNYRGRTFRIELVCHQELPPPAMRHELDWINHRLSQLGIGFKIVIIQIGNPSDRRKQIWNAIKGVFRMKG